MWHIVSSLYRLWLWAGCLRAAGATTRTGLGYLQAHREGCTMAPPATHSQAPKSARAGRAGGVGRVGLAGAVHTNSGAGPQYCQGWGL